MKIDEILTWAGFEQFPWNSCYILLENYEILAWAGPEQFPWNSKYILIENWWDSVALSSFLEIPITCQHLPGCLARRRFAPPRSARQGIENWWDSGLSWPSAVSLKFHYILIENWWDSGLSWPSAVSLKFHYILIFGWPWAVSSKFILHSNWKWMRFWLGLALSSFLEIPNTF